MEVVKGRHPSRSLVERLIADDAAWQTLHRYWKNLVGNGVKWEDLVAMLANAGADKVKDELRVVYGCCDGGVVPHAYKAILVDTWLYVIWGGGVGIGVVLDHQLSAAGSAHIVSTNGGLLPSEAVTPTRLLSF